MEKQTLPKLKSLKANGKKFAMVTAYDSTLASIAASAEIESVLIGDSLGNVIQGHEHTIPVTIEHMAYHTANVARGNQLSFLISDMPFMSYTHPEQAIQSATTLYRAGAQMVKMEGGIWLEDTVHFLSQRDISVCVHLGLLPQSIHKYGHYKQWGGTEEQYVRILKEVLQLQKAGAAMVLLECVTAELAKEITSKVSIPVIGIGSGNHTDAQVLVIYDLLGATAQAPKFVKNFLKDTNSIAEAMKKYGMAVRNNEFPI